MTLAVLTGVLGAPSETFVRRHVVDLLPGDTVTVARRIDASPTWHADGPVLLLDALSASWAGPEESAALVGFLEEHRVDAVLAEFLDLWAPFVDAIRSTGARVVGHAHGYDVSARLGEPYWREAYRAWNAADVVVTMSEHSRIRLEREAGLERVEVVPYGVDVPGDPPLSVEDPEDVRMLAVGRLVPKKAPLDLLRAFHAVHASNAGTRLDVVGAGPLRNEVATYIEEHGLPVTLHGARGHAEGLRALETADIFVQHSRTDPETGDQEGLPVAILEAMAMALPVASTRHAGIPEAVVDGVTGFLCDEGDVDGMAEALALLVTAPERRVSMGRAGWERAALLYAWPRERAALAGVLGLW